MEELRNNIAGLRSGRLTAVERTEVKRRGTSLWLCRCDCGRELLLEPYKIKRGDTKSCGCARKGHGKDLRGQRFGRLTVIERLEEKSGPCYLWRCRCDCGAEVSVPTNRLTSGNTASCGCAKGEGLRERAVDIRGERFGQLTALRPLAERRQGSVVWECVCDCGNTAQVSYNSLLSGNTRSCGCLKQTREQPGLHYIDGTCVEMLERKSLRKDNTSGCTGVQRAPRGWSARIGFKGKNYYLGTFPSFEDAVKTRQRAEEELFGGFLAQHRAERGEA